MNLQLLTLLLPYSYSLETSFIFKSEENGQTPQKTESYHSEMYVMVNVPASENQSTTIISLEKRTRLDSILEFSTQTGNIDVELTIDGTNFTFIQGCSVSVTPADRWYLHLFGNYGFILPNGTNFAFRLRFYNTGGGSANITILLQYTVFS